MDKKLRLEVIEPNKGQHFVMSFGRPGRVEVSLSPMGSIVAYAYEGTKTDMEQEPSLVYDGHCADEMRNMTK